MIALNPPAVPDYATCKDYWLRMAGHLAKADSAKELAAALLPDTAAPYHSFDAHWICVSATDMGDVLGGLVLDAARRERRDDFGRLTTRQILGDAGGAA